jgi:deoxyribonuclease V
MLSSLYPLDELWAITQLKYEGKELSRVAGVDVSYRDDHYASALVTFEGNEVANIKVKAGVSKEPYTPSLFFLKEGPIISDLIYKEPIDLLFVNGHGICHPYSYGLATVVGMTHGIPTVGFARELIKGDYDEAPSESHDVTYIAQKGIIKAAAIRTTKGKKPVYISQGFGISLKKTIEEYRTWATRGKVPEPLRLAHLHAKRHALKGEKLHG